MDLKKLYTALEGTKEAEARTLFNSYSSKSLKDTKALMKVLEKTNLHLIDLGKKINHIINFERVALKKKTKTNDGDIKEAKNRIRLNEISVQKCLTEKAGYLQKFDLQEENLHVKISELVHTLPDRITKIVNHVKKQNLDELVNFYTESSSYMNPSLKKENLVPKVLTYLKKFGDASANDFNSNTESGVKPFEYVSLFNKKGYFAAQSKAVVEDVIDWSDMIQEGGDDEIEELEIEELEMGDLQNDNSSDYSVITDKRIRSDLFSEVVEVSSSY